MKKVSTQIPGIVVGTIGGASPDGKPLVRWESENEELQAIPAAWFSDPPDWDACKGSRCIVGFENGDPDKPLLLGLLDAPATPVKTRAAASTNPEVLHLESEKELVLKCGKAQVSLRADGRVVILGGYVVSRSRGVNKIKGGSVQIN